MKTFLIIVSLFWGFAMAVYSQTQPVPQNLPYQQGFSGLAHSSVIYPQGWQGWILGGGITTNFKINAPTDDEPLNNNASASSTAGGVLNFNGSIGLLPTSTKDPAIVLAISTLCHSDINVSYQVSVMRNPGTRLNELGLQYRVGTSGNFTNIPGSVYQNDLNFPQTSGSDGQFPQWFSITLPAAANNQPVVQVRWVTRDGTGSGSRASFSLDSVSVAGSLAKASFILSDDAICTGTMVNFTNTSTSAGSYEWQENNWAFSTQANVNRVFNIPGTYMLSLIANPGSCADTSSVFIEVSDPIGAIGNLLTGNTSVCEGASEIYSISPVANATEYHWFFQGGWQGISSTDNISAIIGANSGNVEVYASNACDMTATVALFVNVTNLPAQPGIISGLEEVCEENSGIYTILPVNGADFYVWALPAFITGSSITESIKLDFVAPGNGQVLVSAVNSCGPGPAGNFEITVHPVPNITISASSNSVCLGESTTLTASGADIYQWQPTGGSNPITVSPVSTTTYTVNGATIKGCEGTANITIWVDPLPEPTITQNGIYLTASVHPVHQWYLNGSMIPGANLQTHTATANGSYTVEVENNMGCRGMSDAVLVNTVGIVNSEKKQVQIYPNPSNGIFDINMGYVKAGSIKVFDMTGRDLTSHAKISETNASNIIQVRIKDLSPGVYWLKIEGQNVNKLERIVVR